MTRRLLAALRSFEDRAQSTTEGLKALAQHVIHIKHLGG